MHPLVLFRVLRQILGSYLSAVLDDVRKLRGFLTAALIQSDIQSFSSLWWGLAWSYMCLLGLIKCVVVHSYEIQWPFPSMALSPVFVNVRALTCLVPWAVALSRLCLLHKICFPVFPQLSQIPFMHPIYHTHNPCESSKHKTNCNKDWIRMNRLSSPCY